MARPNPLKLNKLQLRTLAIAQLLAREGEAVRRDPQSGEVALAGLPQPHGDHFHIGGYTLPARAASGLFNAAVWTALSRKGLGRSEADGSVVLTVAGQAYDTGFGDAFQPSDH